MTLEQGQILNNRYRIVQMLGRGGFGAVYRAWDMNLDGPCAVKENFDITPEAQKQFAREASLLFNLRHPNLPKVTDHFSLPDLGQYLVMEFIDGEDLESLLESSEGPLSEAEVLPWISQICDALSYLHSRNPPIIHRDLKPANVRITPEGVAFLVDFGIAKTYDPVKRTTQAARAVTPGYAPFEQYGRRSTDARSDVYALGAALYHSLTGQVPPESIDRVSGEPLTPPRSLNPKISPQVEAAILHAMALQPENRFKSTRDLKEALNSAIPAGEADAADSIHMITAQRISTPQTAASVEAPPVERLTTPDAAAALTTAPRRGLPYAWIAGGAAACVALFTLGVLLSTYFQPAAVTPAVTQPAVVRLTPTSTNQAAPTERSAPTEQAVVATLPAPSPAPTELASFLVDRYGVPMALVPAGEFQMGAVDSDAQALENEKPRHALTLPAFYIDVYEVTNARYRVCVDAGICSPPDNDHWQNAEQGNYPVVNVVWERARAYCEWRGARLPTEAEWEKAARGGLDGKLYAWGDDPPVCDEGAANGANTSACGGQTLEVGRYAPNGFGLYDMTGNVWEWVFAHYRPYPYNPADGREDPAGQTGSLTRGGSWFDNNDLQRVSYRGVWLPHYWFINVGLRCALSP